MAALALVLLGTLLLEVVIVQIYCVRTRYTWKLEAEKRYLAWIAHLPRVD